MGQDSDPVGRWARRRTQVPAGAACPVCCATHRFLLAKVGRRWLCYEHQRVRLRKSVYEDHHVPDRRQAPNATVLVPANDHRLLEEMKRDWPPEVRMNPTNDPLLRLAGEALSRADIAALAVRTERRAADYLQTVRERLIAAEGPHYAKKLSLPPLEGYADDDVIE